MTGAGTIVDGEDDAESGPLRLCAVTRARKPPEELLRFVAGPDGTIVPDLARRLPGRGVWVDATRAAVALAARQKVFARSLKRPVTVSEDLPALVERLLAKRLADAISIANKAGLLVAGSTKVGQLIEQGRAAVLIHAVDAAADGVAKLDRKFKALGGGDAASGATVAELASTELSVAIGRTNVIHAAAAEGGASQRLFEEARRLRRYRHGDASSAPAVGHEPNTGRA